jgi:hypothetical protein
MLVGSSQIDITPRPGVELTGFARRAQPSLGVRDPLLARGLYLEDGPQRLLWLQADLLGVERSLVKELRRWIEHTLGIPGGRVMLSATHTHSGPATVRLTGCGRFEAAYVDGLLERLKEAARQALAGLEPCRLVTAEGRLELGVDRTQPGLPQADPCVGAVAWRRRDGSFKAVALNYAMHPVSLEGRLISADYPGQAALALSAALPGAPLVLVSIGACGNINPPRVGVADEELSGWGCALAAAVADRLQDVASEGPAGESPGLKVGGELVRLPLECWSAEQIDEYAERCLADREGDADFGGGYRPAIEHWRASMRRHAADGDRTHEEIELFAVALGGTAWLGINAEIFSQFTAAIRARAGRAVYTISCANGLMGYIPAAEAYDGHGYEVARSMLFFNTFRPQRGGLELLAECGLRQVAMLRRG